MSVSQSQLWPGIVTVMYTAVDTGNYRHIVLFKIVLEIINSQHSAAMPISIDDV